MRIKAYVDEDVPLSFAEALRNRGVDCVTTQEAGNKGLSDAEQLAFTAGENRTVVTHNRKDFILLHNEYARSGKAHAGIVVADQLPVGLTLKRFMKLWFAKTTTDMANRLEFLSNWK
jgi:predicted nuclease of predicted toxin-antitoxin system